jgi:membrane dipeptidase
LGYVQVFAVFIPDGREEADPLPYFYRVKTYFERQLQENAAIVQPVLHKRDLCSVLQSGKIGAVLSVEGGSLLQGEIGRISELYGCGVRLLTLTWNGPNLLGCGAFAGDAPGLTDFGKAAVLEMERLGMVADVSHLNRAGFYDVAGCAQKPFVASHSNAAALTRNPCGAARNLTDDQIKILIEKKGLMGINFCPDFLSDSQAEPAFAAVYRHLAHVLDLGGADILAIGSDFDGCPVPAALAGPEKSGDLYAYLLRRGIPPQTLEKIFWGNAYGFFEKML